MRARSSSMRRRCASRSKGSRRRRSGARSLGAPRSREGRAGDATRNGSVRTCERADSDPSRALGRGSVHAAAARARTSGRSHKGTVRAGPAPGRGGPRPAPGVHRSASRAGGSPGRPGGPGPGVRPASAKERESSSWVGGRLRAGLADSHQPTAKLRWQNLRPAAWRSRQGRPPSAAMGIAAPNTLRCPDSGREGRFPAGVLRI